MPDMHLLMDGQVPDARIWNRGLAFGDGVFETITFRHGQAPLWRWHMRRLTKACTALELDTPDQALLGQECSRLLPQPDGVVRITLLRAATDSASPSLSAYGSAPGSSPVHRLLRYRPLPPVSHSGLTTDWGDLRLCRQPLLAGIKHLNRLEQVLAAREAARKQVDELLLQDSADRVIEAISSNLLVFDGHAWCTPTLHDSGVAGVMRQWLLEHALITEHCMRPAAVTQAQALALCNSVRGIQAITRHAGQVFPAHSAVSALRSAITLPGFG